MVQTDTPLTIRYRCPSCDTEIEADESCWANWFLCPICQTPTAVPERLITGATVTAGTLYIGPESTPFSGSNPSRYAWLDQVVPPQSLTAPSPVPPPFEPDLVIRDETSPPALASDAPVPAPATTPSPSVPTPVYGSASLNPSAQTLAALNRPAHVPGSPRPTTQQRASGGRVFLGLALCITTVGFLFKMLDGESPVALVFGISALVSLLLLIRPTPRSRRRPTQH